MAHKFVIEQNKAGEYVAKFKYNNEIIFWTEGYSSKASAKNAIESILKNGPGAPVEEGEVSAVAMTKYLISFPSAAMQVGADELSAVGEAARAVIREAKQAGVYVFGGGIAEEVAPVLVAGDGSVSDAIYAGSELTGGFTVLEVPTRAEAEEWARRIAVACRCAQELREFGYDPES